jgi:hypothetical protein
LKERDAWPLIRPFPAQATLLQCNRGRRYRQGHKISVAPEEDYVTQKRQYSTAKYCGCEFMLKIIEPTDKDKDIEE